MAQNQIPLFGFGLVAQKKCGQKAFCSFYTLLVHCPCCLKSQATPPPPSLHQQLLHAAAGLLLPELHLRLRFQDGFAPLGLARLHLLLLPQLPILLRKLLPLRQNAALRHLLVAEFLLAARRRKKQKQSNYKVSLDREDLSRHSSNYFGKLKSNFMGTEFQV